MINKLLLGSFVMVLSLATILSGCGGGGKPKSPEVVTVYGRTGEFGTLDGVGLAARFRGPSGIAIDNNGNLFIADCSNSTIRKIDNSGMVMTFAGAAGITGTNDGNGGNARFNYPEGIAIDNNSNILVVDSRNHTIRKITPAGVVTTLAGTAGAYGSTAGNGTNAKFYEPRGIAIDDQNNIFITDTRNHTIRKIDQNGDVTLIAGTPNMPGSIDSNGMNARFNYPVGIAIDHERNLYVTEYGNHTIRKITPSGDVSTLAGLAEQEGAVDGNGAAARFSYPVGIAIHSNGVLYVTELGNHTVRRITPSGQVTTMAGGQSGSTDGLLNLARFNAPIGIDFDKSGNIYICDSGNHIIRKIIF